MKKPDDRVIGYVLAIIKRRALDNFSDRFKYTLRPWIEEREETIGIRPIDPTLSHVAQYDTFRWLDSLGVISFTTTFDNEESADTFARALDSTYLIVIEDSELLDTLLDYFLDEQKSKNPLAFIQYDAESGRGTCNGGTFHLGGKNKVLMDGLYNKPRRQVSKKEFWKIMGDTSWIDQQGESTERHTIVRNLQAALSLSAKQLTTKNGVYLNAIFFE